jgi:hypothetical protein
LVEWAGLKSRPKDFTIQARKELMLMASGIGLLPQPTFKIAEVFISGAPSKFSTTGRMMRVVCR